MCVCVCVCVCAIMLTVLVLPVGGSQAPAITGLLSVRRGEALVQSDGLETQAEAVSMCMTNVCVRVCACVRFMCFCVVREKYARELERQARDLSTEGASMKGNERSSACEMKRAVERKRSHETITAKELGLRTSTAFDRGGRVCTHKRMRDTERAMSYHKVARQRSSSALSFMVTDRLDREGKQQRRVDGARVWVNVRARLGRSARQGNERRTELRV